MARALTSGLVLIVAVAAAGWLLAGRASADGVYNPNSIEDTPSVYYPGATGPCNNNLDDDYDGYADAADSDCLDPKPPATATSTPGPVNTPTQPPPPTATRPPSLGGVAQYPDVGAGHGGWAIALAAAVAGVALGGAWIGLRRATR